MSGQVGLINTGNALGNLVNGSFRTGFVLMPSLLAGLSAVKIARKGCVDGLTLIFKFATGNSGKTETKVEPKPVVEAKDKNLFQRAWVYLDDVKPKATDTISYEKEIKKFVAYSLVATVSIFVLNKLIGNAPELYNNFAKYLASPLRFDVNFDVIQMGFDYFGGKV